MTSTWAAFVTVVGQARGDSLFYTDGVVEAENAAGVPFGLEQLQTLLVKLRGGRTDHVLSSIEQRLCEHRAGVGPADDVTMMLLRVVAVEAGSMGNE